MAALSNFEPPLLEVDRGRGEHLAVSLTSRQTQAIAMEALCVELVRRYQAGETVKALAAALGMHHQTVRAVIEEAGVPVRTRRQITGEQAAEIRRLYESGSTTIEIGERFGVYASTVQRALQRLGVELRPAARRRRQSD